MPSRRWSSASIQPNERVRSPATVVRLAVLISPEDLEALEETLDVLSDPLTMQRLRDGEVAAAGDVLNQAELRNMLQIRRALASRFVESWTAAGLRAGGATESSTRSMSRNESSPCWWPSIGVMSTGKR